MLGKPQRVRIRSSGGPVQKLRADRFLRDRQFASIYHPMKGKGGRGDLFGNGSFSEARHETYK